MRNWFRICLFNELCIQPYHIKACIIPKTDASITTHFQQYVLFIFICLVIVKIQVIKFWFC